MLLLKIFINLVVLVFIVAIAVAVGAQRMGANLYTMGSNSIRKNATVVPPCETDINCIICYFCRF